MFRWCLVGAGWLSVLLFGVGSLSLLWFVAVLVGLGDCRPLVGGTLFARPL